MRRTVTPRDIIAVFVIVFCFVLIAQGIDKTVALVLTAVTAFYFGGRYTERKPREEQV